MSNDRPSLTRLDEVDPLPLLRALMQRGDGDAAAITLLRLHWLRHEQPAAVVETEIVPIDDRLVAVKARIGLPAGWSVSAHAAVELPDNPSPALEQAELRAVARALDQTGYALTESFPDVDEAGEEAPTRPASPEQAAPAPISRAVNRPAVVDALRKMPTRTESTPQPAAEPTPAPRPQRGDFTVVHDRRPAVVAPPGQPPPETPAASADASAEEEPPLEDYSWTAFWRWAKAKGLGNQAEVAEVIGQPVGRMNPGEIRALLREHGIDS